MIYTYIHLLISLWVVVYQARRRDRNLPYWPIEVSRMAASGPGALLWLRLSSVGLIMPLAMDNALSQQTLFGWVSLLVVAFVPDNWWWLGHMAGVAGLGVAAVWQAYNTSQWALCGVAFVVWAARLFIKTMAVIWWEQRRSLFDAGSVDRNRDGVQLAKQLMFGERLFRDSRTRRAFQLTGLLQWVALGLCVLIF